MGGVVTPSHLTGGGVTPSTAATEVSTYAGAGKSTPWAWLTMGIDFLEQSRRK
jgi:hypothetical protein